jgi:putative two-component system hydrogenase maturation factor HypX/HoxX
VLAERLARDSSLPRELAHKRARRAADEQTRPLDSYREHELARCHDCFFGADPSYHHARARFVYKLPGACTPQQSANAARRAA